MPGAHSGRDSMQLPLTLGPFELVSSLGGSTYGGREDGGAGLSHDVALRVLSEPAAALGGPDFAREATLLARIGHPAVVPVRHFATLSHGGQFVSALVTPRVRGRSLAALLSACRKGEVVLPFAATVHILFQLADVLEAVHRASDDDGRTLGLVHGALSPGRLMVSTTGDLRVLGFGVAWASSPDPTDDAYRSPEQVDGEPPDVRADLYAAGSIAFEMLLGERFLPAAATPLSNTVRHAALATRLADRLPAVRTRLARVHGLTPGQAEHTTDLLVRLLQTKRDQRVPHARALGAALEVLAADAATRRGRRWLAGVVAGAPVTDRGGLHAAPAPTPEPPAEPSPSPAPEGSWVVPAAAGVALAVALGAVVLSAGTPELPTQQISRALTAEELEAEEAKRVPLVIAHTPPLRGPESGDRVFRARLSGGTVDCVPRLQLRAGVGGPWVSRPMRGSGAVWELPMPQGELDAFAGTVEYWIRCGRAGLAPRAQWRSPEEPMRLDL